MRDRCQRRPLTAYEAWKVATGSARLQRIRRRTGEARRPIRHCRTCGAWHVGVRR
jgi:hypothetical protein